MNEAVNVDRKLRGIDILGLIFASLCALEAIVGLLMQPVYKRMFADFGAALPRLTQLMLNPGTLVIAGFVPLVLVVEGVVRRRSETGQVVRGVVAMVVLVATPMAFFAGMYLPIFSTVDAIGPP